MGTTLASVHVYGEDIEKVKSVVSDEQTVMRISPNWVSVFGEIDFINKVRLLSNKLKRQVDTPLIAFAYHDDDMMEFALYNNKERRASYSIHFGYSPTVKKINRFIEDLGFDENLLPRLRKIFRCEDIDKVVSMLEEFFGVALLINTDFIAEGIDEHIRKRDDKVYNKYINKQKKERRINNETRITLINEVDAFAMAMEGDFDSTRFMIAEKISQRVYRENTPTIFRFKDSELESLYKLNLKWVPFCKWILRNNLLLRYTMDGEVVFINEDTLEVTEAKISDRYIKVIEVLDSKDIIFTSTNKVDSFIEKANEIGESIWEFKIENGHIVDCFSFNDNIYAYIRFRESGKRSIIYKISIDGKAKKSIVYTEMNAHRMFRDSNSLYLATYNYSKSRLIQLNFELEEKSITEIKEDDFIYDDTLIAYTTNRILAKVKSQRIILIDIDSGKYIKSDLKGDISIKHIDKYGNIFALKGLSTIFILDSKLNILSRHRVKGYAGNYIESKEGLFVVTSSGDTSIIASEKDKDCMVRVYKIEYK